MVPPFVSFLTKLQLFIRGDRNDSKLVISIDILARLLMFVRVFRNLKIKIFNKLK